MCFIDYTAPLTLNSTMTTMTADPMPSLTDSDIKQFLEEAPLYTWYEFKKPAGNRSSLWIREIDAECEVCKQLRPFQDLRARGSGVSGMAVEVLKSGTSSLSFTCVSCRTAMKELLVEHVVSEKTIRIQKYGERPRKPIPRVRAVQRFLKDDLDNYEKAVVCLSHGYGIAAFAYFRRVIESNINRLLDLIQEDSAGSQKVTDALAELRKESPMSEKIKVANQALPEYLKPDGLNPLGRLYQTLSEGVHSLSDEECLNRAKVTSECLAFLVSELASRKEHRTRFKSMVGQL
jgi:hypothetical protein